MVLKVISWVTLCGMLGSTACSLATSMVTATPVPLPTAIALEPAVNYIAGVSQIPGDMYLFVERYYSEDCSQECVCPAVQPPAPAYGRTKPGDLCISHLSNIYFDPIAAVSSGSILGLMGAGGWQEHLYAIKALPYDPGPDLPGYPPIYNVNSDGTIVIGIRGKAYYLKTGQSWFTSIKYKSGSPAGCIKSYESRFTNVGFLKRQSLKVCDG